MFIMFKVVPTGNSPYSLSISLYQVSVNQNHLILYLSGGISNPGSIILTYKPLSNLSKTNVFPLSSCDYVSNSSNLLSYTFLPTSSCNFSIFQGSYVVTQATYDKDGGVIAFVIKSQLPIGYENLRNQTYATISLNPQIVSINANTEANVNTNMLNSSYSLSLGNYIIKQCTGISTKNSCLFNVNSSIGVNKTNSFYELNAYVYNGTENDKINASIYVS